MRLSHSRKFLFISITKCASSSVRRLLDNCCDPVSYEFSPHVSAKTMRNYFYAHGLDWDSYFKFTVVRDPVARFVSDFRYKLDLGSRPPSDYHLGEPEALCFWKSCRSFYLSNPSINSLVRKYFFYKATSIPFFYDRLVPSPMHTFTHDCDEPLIDAFIKLEDFRSGIESISTRLGLDAASLRGLPLINKSPEVRDTSVDSVLTLKSIKRLKYIYSRDYSEFAYV